ncbi:MAG: hypothetical protein ACYTBP_06000 [Planctomycetota bacterium]|jgi:hypothetical protein
MKPRKYIEELIKKWRVASRPEMYKRTLTDALEAHAQTKKMKIAVVQPNIWRIIMKSRITKLAAAVIIIAVLIGINQFGGSIDGTSTAFAQIAESMKEMPWMHGVVEGAGEKLEAWFSFEKRIMASKRIPGKIRYHDYLKNIIQIYDPANNTIKISYPTDDALAGVGQSVIDFPKKILQLFDEKGEKIIQETGKYKGKDSKIYKMSGFLGGMDMKVEMIVDRDKNVLLFINQKAFDKAGTLKMEANGYFDYPENGPNNIYEVGVPTSAKIISPEKDKTAYGKAFEKAINVIDNMENWPEPRDLAVVYWKNRTAKNYDEMAILWPGSAIWNRQSLEKEEPIEYVFGKVQTTGIEGHIIVPYATKSYFEKNGKYNLKMRLSKEKSAKRRYYIVSGN